MHLLSAVTHVADVTSSGSERRAHTLGGVVRSEGCAGSQRTRMIKLMTADPAAQLPKHKRLLRSARSGAILSALMLPAVQLSPPPDTV